MPKILFASNSISHFPGSTIGAPSFSYDANRVPYSIVTGPNTPAASPMIPQSTTQEYWFHFRHAVDYFDINDHHPIIEIFSAGGSRVAYLSYEERSSGGYRLYSVIDGVTITPRKWLPNREDYMRTYDLQIGYDGLNGFSRLYVNELLLLEDVRPITTFNHPTQFQIGGSGFGNTYYTELIVADGDTRNARLDLLRPVAVGAYDNFNGAVGTLSDDDPTTGMTTTLAEQSQSTILTPYTGADNISNIVQVTTALRGINSPANLQHLIRMGGVDYLTADIPISFSKEFQTTDWALNPATSLPWAASDLATAEFGFKSKA